jgi:hypothetical protein
MTHPSPTASPTAIDDKGEDDIPIGEAEEEAEDENQLDVIDCIDGLMELATQAGIGGDDKIDMSYLVTGHIKLSTYSYENRNLRAAYTIQLKI